MRRRSIITWMMAGCSALLFLITVAAPVSAGEPPWVAPATEKAKKNPVPRATGAPEGKKVFETNCLMCHGQEGKGNGPAGVALNPKPADLSSKAVQAQTDGELFWKISTGRGAMPSWQTLPEKDRWSVIDFIRTLGGKK